MILPRGQVIRLSKLFAHCNTRSDCRIIAATTYSLQLAMKLKSEVITRAGLDRGNITL